MGHLYFIFQNTWNRIGNVKPSDSARYRGRGVIWIFPLLITALFFISISHAEVKAKEEVNENDAAKSQAQVTYGKLPLYFIQNDGQVDEKVKFYEKGSGHATFFTKEGVYISLVSGQTPPSSIPSPLMGVEPPGKGGGDIASEAKQSNISSPDTSIPPFHKGGQGGITSELSKLTFLDANPNPEIVAEGVQEGKVNYFIGNDPKKWRTNIPTHQAVLYKEVYPGIDIKFYGNNRQLEYDIIVNPGADPSKVRLAYEEIEGLKLTENGDLEIIINSPSSTNIPPLTKGGRGGFEGNKIIQKKPVIYQEIDGKRVAVEGRFKIQDNTVIASTAKQSTTPSPLVGESKGEGDFGNLFSQFAYTFEVASYDKTHPLVIDPTLVYATYIGGSSDESGNGIGVDAAGNVYVSGSTGSLDFPTTPGAYDTSFNGGNYDAFVVKLDSSGSFLSYATFIGGSNRDIGHRMAVDAAGNVYLGGETSSSDFPTTPGAYDTTYNGDNDAFVVKVDATGTLLTYATYIGGNNYESAAEALTVDASGNAYMTGMTESSDFPTTLGAYDTTYNGGLDAFVAKVDATGAFLSYATYLGGSSREVGYGIAVDIAGNAYVTGQTVSSDFPVTIGAYDTTYNGSGDVFVLKLNAAGSLLSYATYLGGSSGDIGIGITVDTSGNGYVTGHTQSSDFPATPGAYDTTFNGGLWDLFVVKLNASGSLLLYATYIGGSNVDSANHNAVDAAGNLYMSGGTDSLDFLVTPGAYDTAYNGSGDVYVLKLNASGSLLSYATYLGGSNFESSRGGIARDAYGNVYVTWWTDSSDFPTTLGAYDTTYNGGGDVFVVKLNFPIDLPRTGQTTCYDSAGAVIACAGTGQDGEIQAGVPWPDPRFTDNGNGTVTDNLTGLMWTQDANTPGPAACSPATTKTWQEALDYVACLNTNAYLGYTDWRLPNVNELGSLVNAGQPNTASWLNIKGFSNVQPHLYWSSTSIAGAGLDYRAAWFVNMGSWLTYTGYSYAEYKSNDSFYVWPIRAGQSGVAQLWETGQTACYDSDGALLTCAGTGQDGEIQAGVSWPSPRFTDNGNGTVTDNLTGLIWTEDANLMATRDPSFDTDGTAGNGQVTWQHALDYVAKLNIEAYLGYTDWRLSNWKELYSLLDFSQYNPALLSGHPFLNVQYGVYWSSTSYDANAWVIGIQGGGVGTDPYSDVNFVWPVRGGILEAPLVEICDGIDNDGDGLIDEGLTSTYYEDADGDTYGNISVTTQACTQPSGYVQAITDCNDGDASINPGAAEVCDGMDNDCNSVTADGSGEGWYGNLTICGVGACSAQGQMTCSGGIPTDTCTAGTPAATDETCDGADDDCDGQVDEDYQAVPTACGVGACGAGGQLICLSGVLVDTCSPGTPTAELCDNIDNNCDGSVDENLSRQTTCGVGACAGNTGVEFCTGGTWGNDTCLPLAGATPEVCNGIDDNCNGQTDEGVQNTYYLDADIDTFGNALLTTQACAPPPGYVSNSSDCNDGDASINPGATEVCNSIDDNCNTQIDEGCPGVEVCDGIDNDLDGLIDEDFLAGNTSCGSDVQVTPDGVTLTFSVVTLSGSTTVTTSGTGTPPPSGFKLGSPPTYYEITTTVTFAGTVEVCINYDENQFATERSLKLFHWEGGVWENITTSLETVANIICGETTSFSPFIIAEELSTAVTLQNISAHLDGNQVILTWSTSFELNNEGFIILRAESPGGPFTPITHGMIPAMGGSGKATYTFTDSNIEQGKTYYYQLQDIDSRGQGASHRAIPVTVAFARGGEPSQGSTNHEDITARNQQKTDAAVDKGSVENKLYESSEPAAWISVVESNNDIISAGLETGPAEDEMAENRIYARALSQYDEKFHQGIESQRQTSPETLFDVRDHEAETQHPVSGSSSFSVSIEDDKGNIIMVRRLEGSENTSTPTSDIEISEESGRIVLTWQGAGLAKGFILHRAEKGKDKYTPITSLIPYFSRDDKDIFLYRFTDNSVKPGVKYDYRLERVEAGHKPNLKIGKLAE